MSARQKIATLMVTMCSVGFVNVTASGARPAARPSSSCDWTVVPSPAVSGKTLASVDASSPADAWAVGFDTVAGDTPALIEHWDGVQWSLVANPDPDPDSRLYDVTAISSDDVWAVGETTSSLGIRQPLALHWDGSSWSVSQTIAGGGSLSAIDGPTSNDVWAVGSNGQHWNGTTWQNEPEADFGDVAAIASNDVWGVGSRHFSGSQYHDIFGHWDGSTWTESRPFRLDGPRALTAVSANDVWAIGSVVSHHAHVTLAEHWNGSAWQLVESPNFGTYNVLIAVDAKASNDVWAVGAGTRHSIAMHWDGSAWTILKTPAGHNTLRGVASIPGGGWWAVGEGDGPLIERHC